MTDFEDRPRVLIVDDEQQMLTILSFVLETEGFDTATAASAEDAEEQLERGSFDLVVLDVLLPGESGVSLCRRIADGQGPPVMFLTARKEQDDRILGLLAGADDYVAKPFHPKEVALRAEAIVRRRRRQELDAGIRIGHLALKPSSMESWVGSYRLDLTAIEFKLLVALARCPGQVVGVRELMEQVWGTTSLVGGGEMLKAAVYRLRKKLARAGDDRVAVENVRGVGYRLNH